MGSILVHCLDSSQSGCRYASGLIILVNLITIGIEAEMSLQAGRTFRIFEICTSCIMLQNYITYIQLSICSVVGWLVIGSSCFDLCRDADTKKKSPRSTIRVKASPWRKGIGTRVLGLYNRAHLLDHLLH